ncbi:DUF4167 domain-containing protein [Blastomonas sp. SL216]|uniref:DUF4167 domain-containing protein n=1 Tax=Blastomonas sp. SL216 TaxID=2995169 RepID=UPI0023776E19|nr:DUF4167 domain-containing protein [Blastomonas sp. SL216]
MNNNRGTSRRRGRGNNRPQNNGRGGGMDQGNRIDSRARGNATQMLEKYKKMAHDAQMNGDRVATEYYLQFADHYFRVLADNRARQDEYRRPREDQGRDNGGDYADDEDDNVYGSVQGNSQRNYAQDQADEASSRGNDDDDGDEQDEPRNHRRDTQPREARQSEGRQNDNRRERRPREEGRRDEGQREERQLRPRTERRDAEPRNDQDAGNPAPAEASNDDDGNAKPRRTVRGRGRLPRAADGEGSNALDPMILPPAIGITSDAPVEAEAPKPKRRAAPRRKAAESGDVETTAAE